MLYSPNETHMSLHEFFYNVMYVPYHIAKTQNAVPTKFALISCDPPKLQAKNANALNLVGENHFSTQSILKWVINPQNTKLYINHILKYNQPSWFL